MMRGRLLTIMPQQGRANIIAIAHTPEVVPEDRGIRELECKNRLGRQILLFRRLLSFVVVLLPIVTRENGVV